MDDAAPRRDFLVPKRMKPNSTATSMKRRFSKFSFAPKIAKSFFFSKSSTTTETVWGFPKIVVPPNHILIGFSTVNHPFWGTTIFGNTRMFILFFWNFRSNWISLCRFGFPEKRCNAFSTRRSPSISSWRCFFSRVGKKTSNAFQGLLSLLRKELNKNSAYLKRLHLSIAHA